MNRSLLAVALLGAAVPLAACHKNQAADENAAAANNVMSPTADIETLPPDESAGTGNQPTNGDVDANDENDVD